MEVRQTAERDQQPGEWAQLRGVVQGEVQGVGFRYWTWRKATELALTGYVRNRWNGAVEVVAEGPKESLQRLLNALGRGPHSARVQRVSAEWRLYSGKYRTFEVRF